MNLAAEMRNYSNTRRIFKSLAIIVSIVVFGWSLDLVSHFLLPTLKLSPLNSVIVLTTFSSAANLAAASNAPVLYFCRFSPITFCDATF